MGCSAPPAGGRDDGRPYTAAMTRPPVGTLIFLAGLAVTPAVRGQQPQPPAEPPPTWAATADNRPGFTTLLSPGVAPAAVHVSALSCPLAVGTPLTARYAWDFGDPAGAYNRLVGFVAAHVYDRPGTYAVTLTVTDEAGHVAAAHGSVTVDPDRRRAVYVAADGNDQNNGASPAAPLRSAAAAVAKLAAGHTIVMFKAGGTYPVTDVLSVRGTDNVIGRYGDGPKPVLLFRRGPTDARGNGPHGYLSLDGKCDGIMIQHLTLATPYGPKAGGGGPAEAAKVNCQAIVVRGRNVSVRGCSFRDVDDAVTANGNPAGLLVQGCDAPGPTDLRGYLVWGQGTDHAYLGNRVGNSTREHVIRLTAINRVLIADNDLTNLDRSAVDKFDGTKGCVEVHAGRFAYVAGNRVAGGPIRLGPRGGGLEPKDTATDWCVFDGNDLTGGAQVRGNAGTHHAMIRNNLVRLAADGSCFEFEGGDREGRVSGDVTVAHNTGVVPGTSGAFVRVWGRTDRFVVTDNLFVAPHLRAGLNGSAAVAVRNVGLAGFAALSHNLWPVPAESTNGAGDGACLVDDRYCSPAAWAALPQVDGDHFARGVTVDDHGRPAPGGPADGAAVACPGTAFDHDGRPRPAVGPQTAGAFEIAAGDRGTVPAP